MDSPSGWVQPIEPSHLGATKPRGEATAFAGDRPAQVARAWFSERWSDSTV